MAQYPYIEIGIETNVSVELQGRHDQELKNGLLVPYR